jgi:hypothetical protein
VDNKKTTPKKLWVVRMQKCLKVLVTLVAKNVEEILYNSPLENFKTPKSQILFAFQEKRQKLKNIFLLFTPKLTLKISEFAQNQNFLRILFFW